MPSTHLNEDSTYRDSAQIPQIMGSNVTKNQIFSMQKSKDKDGITPSHVSYSTTDIGHYVINEQESSTSQQQQMRNINAAYAE